MSINIKDYLKRKRTSIENFIVDNKISEHQEIIRYCERRGCESISEKEFMDIIKKLGLIPPKDTVIAKEVLEKKTAGPEKKRVRRKSKSVSKNKVSELKTEVED